MASRAHRISPLFCLLVAAAWLGLAWAADPARAEASEVKVSVYDSLATIRSDRPLPPGASRKAEISAARNEFESLQIAVQAGSAPLGGVRVDPGGALRGPRGATIPPTSLRVFREVDYQVSQRSDAEGDSGSWPDALIPEGDAFYGEDRNAFPVDIGPGQRVVAWVDVLIPLGQRPGAYRGSILVHGPGGVIARVPLKVRVPRFTLPSTSTLRSLFGIKGISLPGGDQTLFAAAALNNRVTIANLWPFPESRFVSRILPLLEGNDPRVQLPGAQLTALDAFGCAESCLEAWRDLAAKYPVVGERFINYICDEPYTAEEWSECHATAAAAEAIWPGVRKLVTTDAAHVPAWATELSPVVNNIDRDGRTAYRARGNRRGRKALGKRARRGPARGLWPYTSCRSFSCGTAESLEDQGWPGYAIDQPASQARAMGWLAFSTGATGELYWNTSRRIHTAWTDQYESGGNGDGNLFYPGTPDVVGGSHPIPIESIRLKRIRDGREDYEYLSRAAARDGRGAAMKVVRKLFGPPSAAMRNTTVSPAAFDRARRRLAALIR